jgi:hypothetical protein
MEKDAVRSSDCIAPMKIKIMVCRATWCHIAEDRNFNAHYRVNHKSHLSNYKMVSK